MSLAIVDKNLLKTSIIANTKYDICNLIGWEEYNIGLICTLSPIFVLFY